MIHTATGSDWGTFQSLSAATGMADNCARVLNSPFHVLGVVHTAPAPEAVSA